MPIEITTWLRAYFALRECALETRGYTELITESEDVTRTPRTLGDDAIAIASVIDPFVRSLLPRFGASAVERRWFDCIDDLEQLALVAPRLEYVENESFWDTLAQTCVYLHSADSPLPISRAWQALLAELGSKLRNARTKTEGPFKPFDATTFDDLYAQQVNYLRELRGADMRDPEPGMLGGKRPIPRSTNSDVIALADYWSKQLTGVKKVFGYDGIAKRWKLAVADVDTLARKGAPTAAYPKNNGFFRTLAEVAVHISVADEAPSKSEILLDSVKYSVTHLPQTLGSGATSIANEVEDFVGSAAHAIGNIASSAGKGLFAGFGTPLLVGAGLIGLFLVTRRAGTKEV